LILVQHVSKCYRRYKQPWRRLLGAFSGRGKPAEVFWALRDVNLQVQPGEFVAIIGPNGSGKSTLLQIICGIVQPTSGRVKTKGRIAALLELGAGFNPEFTGRENVRTSCEILGLAPRQIEAAFPGIESFASIGDFIDRPVKEYSSGMYVRLAFSTAIHVEPEILVVDEALAVGDAAFSNRCVQKFEELRQRGVTVLFVSHDLGLVKRLADRAVLMLGGRVQMSGLPKEVVDYYIGLVLSSGRTPALAPTDASADLAGKHRHGDGASRIDGIEILNAHGNRTDVLRLGEEMCVRIRLRFECPVSDPMVGILIRNRLGMDVFGTNTRVEGKSLGSFETGESVLVEFRFPCWFSGQEFAVTVAAQHPSGLSQDWIDDAVSFQVVTEKNLAGVVAPPVSIQVTR
jgi:ABC-type polysaccharide/polyol phosphate transport system ATPase subunit